MNPGSMLSSKELLLSLFASTFAGVLAWATERWAGLNDLSLIFIVAVVSVAARTKMMAAVTTAILCFLAYTFFFIEPRGTFQISAPQSVVTVTFFLLAALIAGRLAAALRAKVLALQRANVHAIALHELGQELAHAADTDQVVKAGCLRLSEKLNHLVWLRIGDVSMTSASAFFNKADPPAYSWMHEHSLPFERFAQTASDRNWQFLPIRGDIEAIGIAGINLNGSACPLTDQQVQLAQAMIKDIGQAALRARLVAELQEMKLAHETERLRSALLSSVSHDLRSPLAAIIGASSSLRSYSDAISLVDRNSLLDTITLEGDRLDRYIQNLLDMTRLGHDGMALKREWIGADELIGSAAQRLRRYQAGIALNIAVAPSLPDLCVHPALIEQAIFNVLENAAKFSPVNKPIGVTAYTDTGQMIIEITDEGPGIPEAERERIFDMFFSVERGDRGQHGTGLGLTICQGMVGAHGGRVQALEGPGKPGTTIRIVLPLIEPPVGTLEDNGDE